MTDPNQKLPQLTVILVTFIGLGLAVYMGRGIGQGSVKTSAIIIGLLAAMAVYLTLGKNAWMLMLFCLPLTGKISVLPLPFTVHDLGIFAAFAAYLATMIFKRRRNLPLKEQIDVFLWINVWWLGFAFLRNPVGVAALGTERVGGQPYQSLILAMCAYFVLREVVVTPKLAPKIPLLMLGGSFIVSFLGVLTTYVPALVPFIAPFYNGIASDTYLKKEVGGVDADTTLGETRLAPVTGLGTSMATYSVARWKPSTLFSIAYPGRLVLFSISIIFIFLSGYRSALVQVFAMFAICSMMQESLNLLVRNMVILAMGLVLVICASYAGLALPKTFQRTLSFLPGNWDRQAAEGADESTEWRVTMWKIALTSDKYIKNKILGDGFGFPASELAVMQAAAWGGAGFMTEDAKIEPFMIQGQFHSGPVTTIRVVGYVGLALYMWFIVVLAMYAWDLAKMTRGSPFEFPARFMAAGAVLNPFFFVFIFGSFADALPSTIIGIGSMKMIKLSYLTWKASQEAVRPSATHPTAELSPA